MSLHRHQLELELPAGWCLGRERMACSRGHKVGETSLGEGRVQFKLTGQGSQKS